MAHVEFRQLVVAGVQLGKLTKYSMPLRLTMRLLFVIAFDCFTFVALDFVLRAFAARALVVFLPRYATDRVRAFVQWNSGRGHVR